MSIETTFTDRTPGSAALARRAERVLPGGDTRAAGWHLPYPLALTHGERTHVFDVDGRSYLDLSNNFTSLVHGHAYPPIVAAAEQAIRGGTAWPARHDRQVTLAEALVDRVASLDHVRFCNSGTEANLLALQVARAVTGKTKVLMASHGYHGSHEAFEAGFFDGVGGHPRWVHTITAPFGDALVWERTLAEHGDEIAAVFLEAVMGSSGLVSAEPSFFERVIAAAHAADVIFVLDEVITLRLSLGGHQASLGITPDLTTMGKLIGGGFPVGGLGGRADLMSVLDPAKGRLFHSGTFNGNPVTTAAGVVSVRDLTGDAIARMAAQAERLERALRESAAASSLPFSCRRVGSLLNIYFVDEPPRANLVRADAAMMARFHLAGMNHGLYFASRGLLVLSTVMTDADIDDAIERLDSALRDVAAEQGEVAA